MLSREKAVKVGVVAATAISIIVALLVRSTQGVVEAGTVIITILSALLAAYITISYFGTRKLPLLFWAIGLWLFAIAAALEVAFAFGVYSLFLIDAYLFIVTVLVEFLALGSLSLKRNATMLYAYSLFIIIVAALTIYSLITSGSALGDQGNMIQSYVVYGALPLSVVVASVLATFPAAAILIIVAAQSYMKKRSIKMLSIIAGVIIVSVAGTLYIVSYPVLLYFSEFVGILLLWLGFV